MQMKHTTLQPTLGQQRLQCRLQEDSHLRQINGNIYSFGGEAPTLVFNTNEKYDTSTNTWSTEASLPTARHGLTGVALDSKIYVISGGLEPTTSKPATGVNEIFQTQAQSSSSRG